MTHLPSSQLERNLILELRRAEGVYRRALAAIQTSLPNATGTEDQINNCLERLQPLMQQVAEIEHHVGPVRQTWINLGQKPGPELKQILHSHEELLKTLIGRIDELERSLQQQRSAAIPAVDKFVKHQQMQKAYQQISR